MSASLRNQQGFSLPEVMLAMVLMVMIVTALSGFQRTLMNSLASRNQYQQLWRHGWQQTQLRAISPPANWQVNRMQTSQAGCVSISVTLVFTWGREGEMTRLHCPESSVVRSRYVRVYHSNRLDVLEALMEFIVERERLDDPFEPEMILVQSTGMAQWLQMTLSQKFGIAANIDFPLPASFIWDMFVRVLPEIPKKSAFNKQSMSWKLMTLLPQLLEREDFTLLRHYLTDDSDKRKLFQLSSKAADLFDQYLVYRPDWLAQWETGHLVEGLGEAQAWQAPLWKALVEYTDELGQPRWHRANLYQRFIETLESATTCPPGLPSRVFICGISALPPVYLQALQALGKHIEIHLLFTNPCRYYWGDIKDPAYLAKLLTRQRRHSFEDRELPLFRDSENAGQLFNSDGEQDVGNPLLASWGKLGRDYIYLPF